jgi:glyoxylase-like metal-dependent hydrolase (beta-lactamase superfamily II)
MKLHTIDTGLFKLDGGAMFGVVPRSMWQRLNPPDEKGLCTWAMRCLLIEDANQLILIDCGLGNKQDAKFMSHFEPHGDDSLSKSLNKIGFSENDITDVLLTHLHFDHCGGAIKKDGEKLVPAFPNAKFWSHSKHWDWAVHPNPREKASFLSENILPIQESGQLKFIDTTSTSINKNIELRTVSGHTESMIIPFVNCNGKTLVYCADLVPSRWHIPIPYVMAYDTRPLLTIDEKSSLLKEAVKNDYYLFLEHDPETEICTVTEIDGRIREKESFRLREIQ